MKAYIITGVSKGLGAALFDLLVQEENIVCALSEDFTHEQVQCAQQAASRIFLIKQDLSDIATLIPVLTIFAKIINMGIEELVFINNAGVIEPIALVGNLDHVALQKAITINTTAPILLTNALLKALEGSLVKATIINVSTGAALKPLVGWALYCSSKAATNMFFRNVRKQVDVSKITVLNIDPGVMDTVMQEKIRSATVQEFPGIENFLLLKQSGQLRSPVLVAQDILHARYVICE